MALFNSLAPRDFAAVCRIGYSLLNQPSLPSRCIKLRN